MFISYIELVVLKPQVSILLRILKDGIKEIVDGANMFLHKSMLYTARIWQINPGKKENKKYYTITHIWTETSNVFQINGTNITQISNIAIRTSYHYTQNAKAGPLKSCVAFFKIRK